MSESAPIPVYRLPDGREFITARDACETPEIQAFVDRFPNYWTIAPEPLAGWVGPLPEAGNV